MSLYNAYVVPVPLLRTAQHVATIRDPSSRHPACARVTADYTVQRRASYRLLIVHMNLTLDGVMQAPCRPGEDTRRCQPIPNLSNHIPADPVGSATVVYGIM
jgi:hypothetical protein